MGWLWASSSPPKPSSPTQNEPIPPPPSTHSAPNEPVDPEIQKFFDLFQSEPASSSKPDPAPESQLSDKSKSSSSSSSSSWFSLHAPATSRTSASPNAPPLDPISESLLPTEMSCRQAFDLAWACNGLGGQWNAVYRYGTMRSCSEQWDDFWFCMRTKSYTGEMKDKMIKAHYRNKEHAKYGDGKPNSEDIWEARSQRPPPGSAFSEKIEIASVDDDEWRKLENERRKRIRESLESEEAKS